MQTTAKYDGKYLKENKIQLLQEPGNCSELSKAVIFHTVREYEVTGHVGPTKYVWMENRWSSLGTRLC